MVRVYIEAGTQQVWLVRPKRRTVTVHHPDGWAQILGVGEVLTAPELLADFSLPLAELFNL